MLLSVYLEDMHLHSYTINVQQKSAFFASSAEENAMEWKSQDLKGKL